MTSVRPADRSPPVEEHDGDTKPPSFHDDLIGLLDSALVEQLRQAEAVGEFLRFFDLMGETLPSQARATAVAEILARTRSEYRKRRAAYEHECRVNRTPGDVRLEQIHAMRERYWAERFQLLGVYSSTDELERVRERIKGS